MKPSVLSRAFTLVEVLVVIVILIIITTIAVMSYGKFQGDSRDNARKAKASILAEALEKYYQTNGEYPSVAAITSSNTTTLKSILSISDSDVLIMPGASSNVKNSITADEPDRDKLAYNGESENAIESDQCQNNQNGGCDSFTLQWKNENDDLVEIKSRQSGRPTAQTLTAPATPTLSVASIAGPALRATASGSVCSGGTLNYKLAVNTTGQSPNWATITWTTGSTIQQSSPVPGTTYYFFAIAGCLAGSSGEVISGQAKKSQLYAATGAPTIALSTSGTNLTATSTATTTCPAGATTKYLLQYDIDTVSSNGSWTTGQNWTTTNTFTTTSYTSSPPRAFNYRAQVRCDDNTTGAQSTPSPLSEVATLLTAPAAPTVSLVSSTDKDTKTWQWPAVSCPVGTSAEYISTYSRDDTTGWRAYPSDDTASSNTSYSLATNYQGYAYAVKTKVRCTVGEVVSAWSGEGVGGTYIRTVDAPAAPTNFILGRGEYTNGSGNQIESATVYWTMPTCGLGTSRYLQHATHTTDQVINGTAGKTAMIPRNGNYMFTGSSSFDGDDPKWRSTSTTISSLDSYYRLGSSTTPILSSGFLSWVPVSSNPIYFGGFSKASNRYVSSARVYARHLCQNPVTERYMVGLPALSSRKTWTGP